MLVSSVKIYNIYKNNNIGGDNIKIIEDNINYNVLFFGFLWFLYHKIWLKSFIIMSISAILVILNLTSINIFFYIFIATNANSWLGEQLQKSDYKYVATLSEANKLNALKTYYSEDIN